MDRINFTTYVSEGDPFKFKHRQIDIRQLLDLVNDDDKKTNSAPGAVLTEYTLPTIALSEFATVRPYGEEIFNHSKIACAFDDKIEIFI